MAVEVDRNHYAFRHRSIQTSLETSVDVDDATELFAELVATSNDKSEHGSGDSDDPDSPDEDESPTVMPDSAIFYYNPLHDMESGWWICLEVLLNRERRWGPRKDPLVAWVPERLGLEGRDRTYARKVFYGDVERLDIIANDATELKVIINNMPPRLLSAGKGLLQLRQLLADRYCAIEAVDQPVPEHACNMQLYTEFKQTFKSIASNLNKLDDIILSPLTLAEEQKKLFTQSALASVTAPAGAVVAPGTVRATVVGDVSTTGSTSGAKRKGRNNKSTGSKKQKVST